MCMCVCVCVYVCECVVTLVHVFVLAVTHTHTHTQPHIVTSLVLRNVEILNNYVFVAFIHMKESLLPW